MRAFVLLPLVLSVAASGPRPAAEAAEAQPPHLTTRESAWFLGQRLVQTALRQLGGQRAPRPLSSALARLETATGIHRERFPRTLGSAKRDGPAFGAYLRTWRSVIATQLDVRFDASHGALFRLALNAEMLISGYIPAHPLTRQTLSDMRSAMPTAGLPATLIEPVRSRMHARASHDLVRAALEEFKDEVRYLLASEVGTPLAGALPGRSPPSDADVWTLGGFAAHALVLHVHGEWHIRNDVKARFEKLAERLGVPMPQFPADVTGRPAETVKLAYPYLLNEWAPPIAQAWDLAYAGPQRYLFSIPLNAIRFRFEYGPNSPHVTATAYAIKRAARYAALPDGVIEPFTDLLDQGAPHEQVLKALPVLLARVEHHLRKQERGRTPPR